MQNLFGETIPEPTAEELYHEYINSRKWKRRAAGAIERAGSKCQRCGTSAYSKRLEVHHITYESMGFERDEDLEVLCEACHKIADEERVKRGKDKHKHGALTQGFISWMDRGNDSDRWRSWSAQRVQGSWERFIDYLNNNRNTNYKAGTCPLLLKD